MQNKVYEFEFGAYIGGEPLFIFNKAKCTHSQAALMVGILDMVKHALPEGAYFACDYTKKQRKGIR